jgi:hypothetical protein
MEWWQPVLSYLTALELWQLILVIIAIVLVALLIGTFIVYLITRLKHKHKVTFFGLFFWLFGKKPKAFIYSRKPRVVTSSDYVRQVTNVNSAPPEVQEPAKFPIPELLSELKHNRRIATEFSGNSLLALQTDVWDAHQYSIRELPSNLRDKLEQVYANIRSLNNIVWLSTELGHRTAYLDDLYRKLLASITEELQNINQNVE